MNQCTIVYDYSIDKLFYTYNHISSADKTVVCPRCRRDWDWFAFEIWLERKREIPFRATSTGLGHTGVLYIIVARISRNNLNETSAKEFRADLISRRVRVLADCTDSAGKISRKLQRVNNFLSSLTVDCCYYYSDLSRYIFSHKTSPSSSLAGVTVKYMFRKLG